MHQGHAGDTDERPPAGTRRLRICFLIDNLGVGGTELQLLRLIRSLDRSSFDPVLCLLDGTSPSSLEMEPDNCEVVRLGVRRLCHPQTFIRLYGFVRFLKKRRIDVLQSYFPDSTYFGALAGRIAGVKAIIRTSRDLFFWVTPNHKRFGKVLDRLCNRYLVHSMVSNCAACQNALISAVGTAPRSLSIIGNGIDLDRFSGLSVAAPGPNEPLKVGIVAMLRAEKRVDLLLEAIRILHARGEVVSLSVAGEGPQRKLLAARVREYGLDSHVRLQGRVEDIPSFLSSIHISVSCSDTEGLSNALIEAMAAGRAVVATEVGGNRELVRPQETGLLVPVGDATRLASAISQLNRDRRLISEYGRNARGFALARFSVKAMVSSHELLYQQLCSPAVQ